MIRSIFAFLVLTAFVLTSCIQEISNKIDDIESLTWNPTLAVPLTTGDFTIDDFADSFSGDDFFIDAADDGLVIFKYSQDQIFSKTAEEMVGIDDENYATTIVLDPGVIADFPISGAASKSETHHLEILTPEGDLLHSAVLKGGQLMIALSADFPASGSLSLTFNSLVSETGPLSTTFSWTYTGSGNQQFERALDLNGVEADFTSGGTTTNEIEFLIDLRLNYEGQPVTTAMGVDLDLSAQSLKFSQVLGVFATRSIASEQDAMDLSFVEALDGGSYYFDEPKVTFEFSNSFGVPMDVTVDHMIGHSDARGDLALTGDMIGTPIAIFYPDMSQVGQAKEFSIIVDHENSNVPALFAWQPNTIDYQYEAIINPSSTGDVRFVLDTSKISADVSLELPLYGRFRGLTLVEEYDFDGAAFEELDNALFKLTTVNGFPIDADVQVYFKNEAGIFIDSLIYDDRNLLDAGITDASGKVDAPTTKEIDIAVDQDRLSEIAQASGLVLMATLNTPENETRSVKIYEQDRLILKLFVQTEFEITF